MSELELLTTREIAALLKMTSYSVRQLASARRLPALKVGRQWRFRRQDVEEFLQRARREHDTAIGKAVAET